MLSNTKIFFKKENVFCEFKLRFQCRLFCKEWVCAQYLIHASMITKKKSQLNSVNEF